MVTVQTHNTRTSVRKQQSPEPIDTIVSLIVSVADSLYQVCHIRIYISRMWRHDSWLCVQQILQNGIENVRH